jgi:cytochrome c oxidase subunit III
MATIAHEPPKIEPPSNGHGGAAPPAPEPAGRAVTDRPPEPVRTGIWVGLASIAMTFAALTSALIVRRGSGNDWNPIALPPILYFNTAILVLSSLTLEQARRKVAAFIRNQGTTHGEALGWLSVTLVLGLAFVAGQYLAWLQLRSEGLYLATNPNSSFFYVFTALHALHVLGGLGGLARVIRRLALPVPILRKSTLDATSYYWHFMGMLWIYLLFILWRRL